MHSAVMLSRSTVKLMSELTLHHNYFLAAVVAHTMLPSSAIQLVTYIIIFTDKVYYR